MPTLLEVWESRLGIQEVPGAANNPIIVGWAADAGHPEIHDDETSWCSLAMCSAAKAAGLPFPPVNVNPMARSWLTMGVGVELENIAPGDVAVWPRGNPKGPLGHVNCVKEVRHGDHGVEVRCIGGNQGGLKGGDAVTLTGWTAAIGALGFRRLVPATVAALRPHSSEIKAADKLEISSWVGVLASSALAAVKELLAPVQVPTFTSLPDALTWWQTVLAGLNALWRVALENPWLAGGFLTCLVCILVARAHKVARIERHAAGIPISSQVVGATA
jgi:uncharacterized protein (TIGR02594 family)